MRLTDGAGALWESPTKGAPMATASTDVRLLVIANESLACDLLARTIHDLAGGAAHARVLVVAPALNSRVRPWTSDCDPARAAARERLLACVDELCDAGLDAVGTI